MKIVSWNCNGGLRNKLDVLDSFDAGLYVIQECEDPARSTAEYRNWAGNYLWVGESKNKGLGIFPKKDNSVKALNWQGSHSIESISQIHKSGSWQTSDLRLFLPFSLNDFYSIVAVWTKGSDQQAFGYIGQVWKFLQIHGKQMSQSHTMLIGDLNSNAIWDRDDRWWSHSGVVAELEEHGLTSKYHSQTSEDQGAEREPTFYMHRKLEKSYHIDYAFLSHELIGISNMEIGNPNKWLTHSDHMPIELTVSN